MSHRRRTLRTLRSLPTLAPLALLALLVAAPGAGAGEGVPPLTTELVVSGLTLPVFATAPKGDARIFVLEQTSGKLRVVKDGAVLAAPFLDVSGDLAAGGERGLLGLAFHPQYASNGRFYVTHNDAAGDLLLRRFLVDPLDPDLALADSGETLLVIPKPFDQHNGGMIAFSPLDGMLLFGTGDGGSGGDPFDNAQDLSSLLGKLLRIDVDGPFPYGIPADNPFVGTPGAAPEVYAYGLRNPWRWSFDSRIGAIVIADVGQGELEEVDFIRGSDPGGQNFGWRCMEGTLCTHIGSCACPEPEAVAPIHEYDHNEGCAIIGGYLYRGAAIPELQGHYFFGDYCTSRVWSFTIVDAQTTGPVVERTAELAPAGGTLGFVTSFGEDGAGELLIVGYIGDIRRVVVAADDPDCDGDGVTDADELAAGTAFDANDDSIPDDCQLLLTGTDVIAGQTTTLDFVGAGPGQPLVWFASPRGIGPGPCFFGGNLCLDLLPFNLGGVPQVLLLAITAADAQGHGVLDIAMPSDLTGVLMAGFQVVVADGPQSVKSNPIQKVPQQP